MGQVVSQIDLCAKEAIKATSKKVTKIEDASRLMNELSVHEGFLLSAVSHSVLPRAKVEWVQAIQKTKLAKPMLVRMISDISFKPYISELDGASLMQKDIRDYCISKLSTFRQGRNPDAKLDSAVLDGLDKALRTLSLCVGNKAPGEAVTALDSCDIVYNEMVKLLQDGGGEREVRAEFWLNVHKLLSCVRESQQATPRFQGLGETPEDILKHAQCVEALTVLQGISDVCEVTFGLIGSGLSLKAVEAVHADTKALLASYTPKAIGALKDAVSSLLKGQYDPSEEASATLENVLGGTTTGVAWSDGLSNTANLKECVDKAKKTLNKNRNAKVAVKVDALEVLLSKISSCEATFHAARDVAWKSEMEKHLSRGRVTLIEGCVLFHCQNLKLAKLRSAVVKELNLADSRNVAELLHPAIQNLCNKAKNYESF